jgi:integrase/recombinase XerC
MDASFESAIRQFSDHLQFEKRYSGHTVRSYQDDLLQLQSYIQIQFGETALAEIRSPLIRSWLASLKDQALSSRSIIRKISSLKSFFKFAMRSCGLPKSPMINISSPKAGKRLPMYVEQADMKTLFDHVEFSANWKGTTERLAMEMLYQAGLRLAELIGCKESQVDFSNSSIKVLGKGKKERVIPVSGDLLKRIKRYMQEKKKHFGTTGEPSLLVTEKGKKAYPKYIYRAVTKYLGEVTTIEKKSPHVLRHSFATHLSNNGAELNAIKELLGHASLAATQVYTHNTIEKLKNIHKKAHPKG